jgi:hypothetical protein
MEITLAPAAVHASGTYVTTLPQQPVFLQLPIQISLADPQGARGIASRFQLAVIRDATILVHNGAMRTANKTIRQSISLPAGVAARVRSMAKTRRLSANRMLVELIKEGMEAQTRKQQQFFELAERFRGASDPEEARRLGDELGRMVFGG